MTIPPKPSDAELREVALESFKINFTRKFTEGNRAYRTPLFDKDCGREAMMEVIDLWAYAIANEAHRARAWELLCAFREAQSFEDETAIMVELSEMFRPRELAKKVYPKGFEPSTESSPPSPEPGPGPFGSSQSGAQPPLVPVSS